MALILVARSKSCTSIDKKEHLLHLGMRGAASIESMEPARFDRLLDKYLGSDRSRWNAWVIDNIARINDPSGRLVRLVPETVFTNSVSYFLTGPELAWTEGMPLS
ncbi:hypothetical protein [Salinihabitans flavidus]|uniref:hypothetical protein n=1 Tax=Salinihabitans flavidus TaxID=569882 RepID=UPI001FE1DC68|nr:hypothetical protein [Salinihabitans flavidus]